MYIYIYIYTNIYVSISMSIYLDMYTHNMIRTAASVHASSSPPGIRLRIDLHSARAHRQP